MPLPLLKKYHEEYGISIPKLESMWDRAKDASKGKGYALVMRIFKNMVASSSSAVHDPMVSTSTPAPGTTRGYKKSGLAWWDKKSPRQQRAYLKKHRGSVAHKLKEQGHLKPLGPGDRVRTPGPLVPPGAPTPTPPGAPTPTPPGTSAPPIPTPPIPTPPGTSAPPDKPEVEVNKTDVSELQENPEPEVNETAAPEVKEFEYPDEETQLKDIDTVERLDKAVSEYEGREPLTPTSKQRSIFKNLFYEDGRALKSVHSLVRQENECSIEEADHELATYSDEQPVSTEDPERDKLVQAEREKKARKILGSIAKGVLAAALMAGVFIFIPSMAMSISEAYFNYRKETAGNGTDDSPDSDDGWVAPVAGLVAAPVAAALYKKATEPDDRASREREARDRRRRDEDERERQRDLARDRERDRRDRERDRMDRERTLREKSKSNSSAVKFPSSVNQLTKEFVEWLSKQDPDQLKQDIEAQK